MAKYTISITDDLPYGTVTRPDITVDHASQVAKIREQAHARAPQGASRNVTVTESK